MTLLRLPCIVLAIAAFALAAQAQEHRVVEKKRVVVRLQADPGGGRYSYAYVDHEDGEPVLLESVVADRAHLGVGLLDLTPELRRHFGAPAAAGVMISRVESESPAFAAGVLAGDIVTAIDGREVDSSRQVRQRVAEGRSGQTIELAIWRDGDELTLAATLDSRARKQLDLGGLIVTPHQSVVPMDHAPEVGALPLVELDPESMSRALSAMREHFESPEWSHQLELFHGDRSDLEERIRQLEERLKELESQLQRLPD